MTHDQEIPIEFTGRHESLTERMREHAALKVAKLGRYHSRISRVQLIAAHPHESPQVEMIVHVASGKTFVAKEQSDTFSNAVDVLVEKMERQLKKDNEIRKNHHRGDSAIKGGGRGSRGGSGGEDEESYDDVIRKDLDRS